MVVAILVNLVVVAAPVAQDVLLAVVASNLDCRYSDVFDFRVIDWYILVVVDPLDLEVQVCYIGGSLHKRGVIADGQR